MVMKKTSYLLSMVLIGIMPLTSIASTEPSQPVNTSCQPAMTGNPCASTARAPKINLGAGNPIHLMSGNKFQQEPDMLLRLSGLEFTRYYNAMGIIASPIGAGWSTSYSTRLFKLPRAWQILLDDGQRINFYIPNNKQYRTLSYIPQQGYLQQNSLKEWEWHTPEGTIRTFNQAGYLRQITIAGFPTIHIDYQSTQQKKVIHRVFNNKEELIFHYTPDTLLLSHIVTPVGTFHYHYDTPHGFTHNRLIKVTRADGWEREYLYEPQYQSGNPYRLTGIVLRTPQQKSLRINEWHYQHDGKAIFSRSGFWENRQYSTSMNKVRFSSSTQIPEKFVPSITHEIHLEYTKQALSEQDKSITIVRDQYGDETRITGIIKAGQYLIEEVTGKGCYLCPPSGTHASYDNKGLLTSINGFTLYRTPQGQVHTIEFQHPSWDKVTLKYNEQGYAKSWATPITGERTATPPTSVSVALPSRQQETDLAYFENDTLIFKNNLRLKQFDMGPRFKAIVVEKNKHPFWVQTRAYNQQGLLEKEHFHFVANNKYIENYYLYDEAGHLLGALQRDGHFTPSSTESITLQPRKHTIQISQEKLFYYAWNKDGSSKGYMVDQQLTLPKIIRNSRGLPITIGSRQLSYGKQDRIESIKDHQQLIAQYQYDKYGRRTQKITAQGQVNFHYEGNQLSTEIFSPFVKLSSPTTSPAIFLRSPHHTQAYTRKRHYIYRGVMPIAFTESLLDKEGNPLSSHTFYIHNDHLGLPMMVTDQQQNIRWAAYYTPTGKANLIVADIEFNLRQPGQYFDIETGWHDNYLRTYDPEAGHYLEPDPLGPLVWNDPYGYVAQQPRHFIDPVGLLLFAFDGTTNNKQSDTNVWKFYQLYQGPKFYKEGPGARPGESVHDRNGGKFFGTTLSLIINEQKENFIHYMRTMNNNFTETTPIDIIGFSRGAIAGMIFANYVRTLVHNGLFDYEESFTDNTGITKTNHIQSCVDLRFIGLFDAVSQIGLGGNYNHLSDYTAAPEWTVIAHAIALNEYRSILPLTVYYGGDNVIEQGFLGNHSDLGGVHVPGDKKDNSVYHPHSDYGDLGNIPLAWIYTQAQQVGINLHPLGSIKSKAGNPLNTIHLPVIHNTYGEYSVPNLREALADLPKKRFRDRSLQAPNSAKRYQLQGKNHHIGDTVRMKHIHAAEVEFLHPYGEEFTFANVAIYAKLNAKKYIAWLEKELNWKTPIKVIPH